MQQPASRRKLPNLPIHYAADMLCASSRAQGLVIMTEWPEIVNCEWPAIARQMAPPRFIFYGRNALNPAAMRVAGFEYTGVE